MSQITLHLGELHATQIAFGYAPLRETLCSLHVLADSKHHPLHIAWVLETKGRLTPELKREVRLFAMLYQIDVSILWHLWPYADYDSFCR